MFFMSNIFCVSVFIPICSECIRGNSQEGRQAKDVTIIELVKRMNEVSGSHQNSIFIEQSASDHLQNYERFISVIKWQIKISTIKPLKVP